VAELEKCLASDDELLSSCVVVLIAQSISSRRRDAIGREVVDGQVSFDVDLAKSRHRGLVEVSARIVRAVRHSSPDPARASDEGEVLGESEPIRIHFDEPSTAPGASLDVEWRDFESDDFLNSQKDNLFAIEDSEPPRILLNSNIRMLYEILSNNGPRGRKAKIRESVFAQIVHQVWTSLLGDAASAVVKSSLDFQSSGRSPDAADVLEDVGGWRAAVLKDWAPDLTSESDKDLAIERLVDDLADGLGPLLIGPVPAAIQRRMKTMGAFHGLVAEMNLIKE